MTNYHIPSPRIDLDTFPELLLTSESGSFAHRTLKNRVPKILRKLIDDSPFPPDVHRDMEDFYEELTQGVVQNLREDTPDRAFWDPTNRPYLGRSWLDVPWFWAEAYFYRRILQESHYFQPGPMWNYDPNTSIKQQEWAAPAAPTTVDAILSDLPEGIEDRFERLIHANLWGNRVDLSYNVGGHLGNQASKDAERENLLVDDTPQLWEHVQSLSGPQVVILCDNAGTELLMDLALAAFMLDEGLAGKVTLHLKNQPYFVSDAMPKDVFDGIIALESGGEAAIDLARRLSEHIGSGRLCLFSHWFYTTSLFYYQLPADLRDLLATMDLVLVKGDANYRRLHGDAHWPFTTPFAQVLAYFPAPMVALRTLKGQHVLGLQAEQIERLSDEDSEWMVIGRRGVIQSCLPS